MPEDHPDNDGIRWLVDNQPSTDGWHVAAPEDRHGRIGTELVK